MSTSADVCDRLNAALAGRYRIERKLGEGGMATVYLADDLKHERKVAIKVLRPELAAVVGSERFLAEIKTTAALQHPNILPLFDSGEADGFLFYVMPYVEGESLRERLDREKQLRVADALDLTRKVADALDYAHSKGVVHRDVKPANILISERGEPLVADFGIALAVSQAGGGRITETGLSLGTPHYMSPEQATGDRDVDPRSDVYALGCVLYEMLAGQPPFHAPTAQAVLARILTEPPRRVDELRRTVPRHVAAVLEQALEKLPADRFESAPEFVDALDDEGFTHASVTIADPPPRERPAMAARPRSGPLVPALVTGLAAMTAVAAFGWLGRGAAGGGVGEGPPVRTVLDLGGREFSSPQIGEVVISPDGSRFAFGGVVEGDRPGIFHRTAGDLEFTLIPGTEDARRFIADLTFSPDNQWIAYTEGGGRLMKVSLLGGQPTPVVPEGDLSPRLIDWSVEGTIVFWAGAPEGEGMYRVADNGGTPVRLFGAPEWTLTYSPQLLPDGSAVLFTDVEAPQVAVYDIAADSVRVLVPGGFDATYVEDTGHLLYLDEGGGLWAVPFDPARLELEGEAKPVLQDVTTFRTDWGRYSVSRGGTMVFGTGGGAGLDGIDELLVVDFDGTETVLDLPPRPIGSVRWAADGRRIVFDGLPSGSEDRDDYHIFTYDVELENAPDRLTNEGDNWRAVWSPDGRRVAFTSVRDGTDGPDLFVRNVYDDLPPRLLLSLPQGQFVTDWPEDSLLVVESGWQSSILLLHLVGDSATVTPYYEPDADVDDGVVSPDGTLMAYASNESGQEEVYIRAFPTPRTETIVSEGGGFHPVWSPSGDTLYYACENSDAVCAAEIQREPTAAVVSRWTVMEWPYGRGELHPDGDRLITVRDADDGTPGDSTADEPERHIVIHNWFGELRRIFDAGEG